MNVGGMPVAGIPLDDIITLASSMSVSGRVKLLKLDCEGAEWPILLTSKTLAKVESVVGEYHKLAIVDPTSDASVASRECYGPELLHDIFEKSGFASCRFYERDPRGIGMFHAWRDAPVCDF